MINDEIIFQDENIDKLIKIFSPEFKSLNTKRFSYKIKKINENTIEFNLKAIDNTGMKIVKTSINKLITIYKKIKKISN
jgi:hypothetical protein